MVFLLVPCSLSVCLSADILQTSMFPRKLRVGKLCWVPNLVGWYLTVGKGKGIFWGIF